MTCRPGHALKRPEFVDLGPSVVDAHRGRPHHGGLHSKKALPWWMPGRLDEVETEWFRGRPLYRDQHSCIRVELNAFPAPELTSSTVSLKWGPATSSPRRYSWPPSTPRRPTAIA